MKGKGNNIYLNNNPLLQISSVNYLGIVINDKSNFRKHTSFAAVGFGNLYTAHSN